MGLLAVLFLLFSVGLGVAAVQYSRLTADLPALDSLPAFFDPAEGSFFQPTRIYDRTGSQLLLSLENPGIPRRYLKVDAAAADHFSPELLRAAVAVLDPAFWNHPGIISSRLFDPQPVSIAERLAFDQLLSQEPAGTRRALRMRLLALQMVSQYGRTQVLEWYLNSASFGHLAYGAEAAARLYFDKSAAELNLAEAALLMPVANAPALNPFDSPSAARERQRDALDAMLEQGTLSEAEYTRAVDAPLRLQSSRPPAAARAEAFTDLTLRQLTQIFGRQRLERGGLTIITSLDYALQQELECLARTQLRRLQGRDGEESLPDGSACQAVRLLPTLPPGQPLGSGLSAAGALLDPTSGQVLAMLGDTRLDDSAAPLAAHAPGSLLTPFAAASAFARGYSPASLVWDIPQSMPAGLDEAPNADGLYHGPLRLRSALANDYLTPLAQLVTQAGSENAWRLAAALGLPALREESGAGVLFDGGRSTPAELAFAYAAFSNQGRLSGLRVPGSTALQPVSVLFVQDAAGVVLLDAAQPETQSVLSGGLAYLVHAMLSDEQARWPSLGYPNPLEIGRPAGAKVGRVGDGSSVWAAGYTLDHSAVIWLGYAAGQSGSDPDPRYAAGIWHALMQFVSRDRPARDWPVPPDVTRVRVCDPSGQLPTAACPAVVDEVFLSGNEPVSSDSLYREYQVNRETGRLATVFTPPGLVDRRVYMLVPPEAREWAEAAGIEVPPEVYDTIQPPAPSPFAQVSQPAAFAVVRGKVTLRGTAGGEDFAYYRLQAGAGLNPQSWLQIGPDVDAPVSNGVLGTWDTSGLEGLYALRLLVVRSDQSVETATLQVTVDNTPPLARATYPLPKQQFALAQSRQITFQAEVSDVVGLQRVEWLLDGKVIGQNLAAPYSLTWTAQAGEHSLVVRALDLAGNVGESIPVVFTVTR